MLRWWNFRHSIFFKFTLAFLVIGLIPTLALSTLSMNQMADQIERRTENSFKQMMIYSSKNVDDILGNYNELSKSMYTRSELLRLNTTEVDAFLKTLLYSDDHIQNTFFIRASDETVFYQSRITKILNTTESYPPVKWSYALTNRPKDLLIIPPHLESYYNSTRMVITIGRNLIDITGKASATPKTVGTLYFDIDLNVFEAVFKEVQLESHDSLYVMDSNGYILYSNEKDKWGKRLDEPAMISSGKLLVFSKQIPQMGGRIVGVVSKADLYASVTRAQYKVITIAIVCMFALIALGVLLSRMFTKPILEMKRLMIRAESGHLEVGPAVTRKDDLGRLAHGYNRMIESLKAFINEAYVAEIKQKQAEIKQKQSELGALKSQIRPHFLYNTLEVIRMSAVANDDNEVADMIHALSNQLEYVIDYGEEWVTVERELAHLQHYFQLIEVRFNNWIDLQIELQCESLLAWSMPKLSIQPLVENAVIHGIRPKGRRGGTVRVTIEQEREQQLVVTVYDNGVGMDAEVLAQLNRLLAETDGAFGKSIGVKNVHERIRNACGDAFGLVVQSVPGIGTSVRMRIPQRQEEVIHDEQNSIAARG